MQIFVNIHISKNQIKNIMIQVQLDETIQQVMEKVRDIPFVLCDQETKLQFQGKRLRDLKKSLRHAGIYEKSTLNCYIMYPGGGGPASFVFNNLIGPIGRPFSKEAPDYRIIDCGLNLQGVCDNKSCKAWKRKVWAQKGYGLFNMSKEAVTSKCPLCQEILINVQNLGLYKGIMKVNGKAKDSKQFFEKIYQAEWNYKKNEFLTFEDKDETRQDWLFLEFDVKKLGQIL